MINLKHLNLTDNDIITNNGTSKLTNLISLNLERNQIITYQGISNLVNLSTLNLYLNNMIDHSTVNLNNLKYIVDYQGNIIAK